MRHFRTVHAIKRMHQPVEIKTISRSIQLQTKLKTPGEINIGRAKTQPKNTNHQRTITGLNPITVKRISSSGEKPIVHLPKGEHLKGVESYHRSGIFKRAMYHRCETGIVSDPWGSHFKKKRA